MIPGKNSADGAWIEAFEQALSERGRRLDGLLLFAEERQDAAVEIDDRDGRPRVECSRTSGLSVRGDFARGRMAHRSDPRAEDVPHLVRFVLDGATAAAAGDRAAPRDDEPTGWLPLDRARRFLRGLVSATSELQPRLRIRARWVGFAQQVTIGRPERGVVQDRREGRRVRLDAMLESGDGSVTATVEAVMRNDSEADELLVADLAEKLSSRVDERASARDLPSGERRVVFAPGAGGVLIHEIVGHALEADALVDAASWLAREPAGRPVGAAGLTVLDDPRRGRAPWKVDDEGEPARPTSLIGEGRVVGWLHDLRSARQLGRRPTGHGRRCSYREPVRPRMGCTFVAPGPYDGEEAIESVVDGIYVRRMESASTDALSGRAVFRVTDADRIRDGKIDTPLTPHLMVVEARTALSQVECVANDLAFDVCVGSCLHHGQPLSISVGGPTFRIGMTSVKF